MKVAVLQALLKRMPPHCDVLLADPDNAGFTLPISHGYYTYIRPDLSEPPSHLILVTEKDK